MPVRKRARFVPFSVEAAELLEARTLLSATALGAMANAGATQMQASTVSHLAATPNFNVSTVPANGDLNPYGVAFVPTGVAPGGKLHAGEILVSNFNNKQLLSAFSLRAR